MANAIPEGFNTINAHLIVKDSAKAIEFYKKAFGGEELCRMPGPGGQGVMHAEVKIGNSTIMLCDEMPDWCRSPESIGDSPVTVHMYVADADQTWQKAVDAGAEVVMPLGEQFWGDKYGKIKDPFGHQWSIAQRVKELTPEQIAKNAEEFFANCPGQ